jgi:arylsulfatase A-like enzyme
MPQSRSAAANIIANNVLKVGINDRPNFVFILIDDLGWKDSSTYGSKCYETPRLDQLSREGMLFTDAYTAAAVCSPTRASIMTGKYPARLHLTHALIIECPTDRKLLCPDWTKYMGLEEVTIAEALKEAGYVTGSFGKWHLDGTTGYLPSLQGFDETTFDRHIVDKFYPYYTTPPYPEGQEGEYLTDRLTDDSLKFIEKNKDRPFFVYLSHYAVHVPIEAKEDLIPKYQQKPECNCGGQQDHTYAAMIQSVDESLGRVVDKLAELGIDDRTVVIFISDNGGLSSVTSNAPLRSGKASEFEGGIRVPLVIKWPGMTKPGTVCHEPVTSTDFYPTMLEMAGLPLMPEQHMDGVSLVPLLRQTGVPQREALYWHFPHYHSTFVTPWGAVRKGDWKLIEYFENEGDSRWALYNLKNDIGEQNNLAQADPAKRDELKSLLENWRNEVGAQMPTLNPAYSP